MCKVIFRGNDVEGGLVDIIKTSAPEKLVSVTSNIISSECKNLCKRNSNSVLREKTRSGIVNFSWDEFHKELHLRAPNLLHVVSATVTDVPQSLSPGNHMRHILYSIAVALRGRSREMTVLQYLTGFIMLHGGCTQRVGIFSLDMQDRFQGHFGPIIIATRALYYM